MSKQTIQLPPTTSMAAVISWFRQRYLNADVEEQVAYLESIMRVRRLHIKDFRVGTEISDWSVNVQVGTSLYEPGFTPELTPDIMLRLGIFGGLAIKGIETQIPIEWVIFALFESKLTTDVFPHQNKNYFLLVADPYPSSGDDSREFFHWFCRYYLGRRSEEDSEMIEEWKSFQSKAKAIIKSKVPQSAIVRQLFLQWSIMI